MLRYSSHKQRVLQKHKMIIKIIKMTQSDKRIYNKKISKNSILTYYTHYNDVYATAYIDYLIKTKKYDNI